MGQILHGGATTTHAIRAAMTLKTLRGLTPYETIRRAWAEARSAAGSPPPLDLGTEQLRARWEHRASVPFHWLTLAP